ncbi:uncharacterized protein BHQ10_009104 [Talaromyces amestolkiae]|uniref:LysM domain-containing protein n=1 Tax=Talaromyces amestolkiae TaxID=1196081 RepID=A0A364LBB0_TALAM|nr:uncharacterized protein BHQ10_009104 [Talaromyces amestolkiae]RAO73092.1 hypothetical protein BHQ10_009104 [Talaromyces amestolkiae]
MILTHLIAAFLASKLATGYLVTPSGTAFPGADSDCSGWVAGTTGISCANVVAAVGITLTEFETWNPLVADGSTCELTSGFDYCIQVDFESSTSTTLTATTTLLSTTSGISTPSPVQTGLVANCNKFYLLATNDTCASIAADAGLSLATFYSWNPAVGGTCADLEIGDYVCIDTVGYTFTSVTASATTTTTGDGISTPSPIQTGMVPTCDKFYLVVTNDTCSSIATAAGISLATFYSWNPAVGSSCAYLGLGDYVCIDIIGYTITTTTASATATSTTTGDGISTPSPIQTGMVSTCDQFHLVVSGDECATIAADAGISLDTFYSWNPAVGSSCAYLGLGDYVCIDIIGYTPSTTTTSTSTTTTSAGNGVTTPTPYETGMVSDCDVFHLVVSGDTCTTIAESANITVADIEAWNADVGTGCTGIWLGYYICVGIL